MGDALTGLRELSFKLNQLETQTAAKQLRNAALKATTRTVRKMKMRVPVGTEMHRTYRGRLVAPGFAKRALRRRTSIKNGKALVRIGVLKEAYYALFYDEGLTVTSRRAGKGRASNTRKGDRRASTVRPYSLRGTGWFKDVFVADEGNMLAEFTKHLRKNIDKAKRA